MVGVWNVSMRFTGANFTDKISPETLAEGNNLPGFAPYSVLSLADMGRDVDVTLRYVQIDGHPREDHPANLRSLLAAFAPDATVVDAAYAFQKAPDWFHSPANRWRVKLHDVDSEIQTDLLTRKRSISVVAGAIETTEWIQQTLRRRPWPSSDDSPDQLAPQEQWGRPVVSDYALNWRIFVPASLRDEFVTTEVGIGACLFLLLLSPLLSLFFPPLVCPKTTLDSLPRPPRMTTAYIYFSFLAATSNGLLHCIYPRLPPSPFHRYLQSFSPKYGHVAIELTFISTTQLCRHFSPTRI
jgi:hypothetical protein